MELMSREKWLEYTETKEYKDWLEAQLRTCWNCKYYQLDETCDMNIDMKQNTCIFWTSRTF